MFLSPYPSSYPASLYSCIEPLFFCLCMYRSQTLPLSRMFYLLSAFSDLSPSLFVSQTLDCILDSPPHFRRGYAEFLPIDPFLAVWSSCSLLFRHALLGVHFAEVARVLQDKGGVSNSRGSRGAGSFDMETFQFSAMVEARKSVSYGVPFSIGACLDGVILFASLLGVSPQKTCFD